mmetsp:Transcript_109891/g.289890  ORF Transcript_109891/g.289890 Transcript_109891/m.289890 type:complete len:264 (+) Transcript_109891:107-898(+)
MQPGPSGAGSSSSPPLATGGGAADPPANLPLTTGPFGFDRLASIMFGLWIVFHSSEASWPRYAMMACSPPGCTGIHLVTSSTWPLTTIHASSFVLCLATSASSMPSPLAGAAAAAPAPPPPEPSLPMIVRLEMFFWTMSFLWIMFHSSVASFPKYAAMACSPPGWIGIHLVTSMTSPFTTSQASSLVLCFATSSRVIGGGPADAASVAGAATAPLICRSFTFAISSSFESSSSGLSDGDAFDGEAASAPSAALSELRISCRRS